MAISFFTGDALTRQAKMQSDRLYMIEMFRPWYDKAIRWKEMLLPEVPVDKQANNYSSAITERLAKAITGSDQPYRAHTRSSFVHTGSTAIINRMIRSEIIIETNMNARDESELEKSDLFEDFNQGLISKLNYDFSTAGEGTGFVRSRFESIVNHGKAITFAQMRNVKGRAVPYVETCDPLGCYHTFRGSVRRFGRDVPKSPEDVERIVEELRNLYGNAIKMPVSIIEAQKAKVGLNISDYWAEEQGDEYNTVWRGLMVNGECVYLGDTAYLRMPVMITAVNSVSSQYRQVTSMGETVNASGAHDSHAVYSSDFISNHAEPWYAAGENTIGELDTLVSLELEATHLLTFPPVEVRDERTNAVTGWATGRRLHTAGAAIYTTQGQALKALDLVKSSAAEARELMTHFKEELGYLLPPQVRGQTPFAGASGYLQNQLTDAQKNALVDVFAGGSIHLKAILQELDQQFYDDGDMKIRLNARVRDGLNVGAHYPRDFSVADFPEHHDFTVIIDPMVGENDAAAMQLALNGMQGGVWDDLQAMQVVKVRHPLQMKRRIQAMQAESSPVFAVIRLKARLRSDIQELSERIDRARGENREDEADMMELTLVDLQGELKKLTLMGQPQQAPPALPSGFSPDVVPPQETGDNPQEAAAAQGRTSVGMQGQGKGGNG